MKNKINNYDFLVIGAGLIGSLTAISLLKNKYKVLVIDKNKQYPKDNRTLAVNANSKDFLVSLGLWNKLKANPEPINKIEISDTINQSPLIFENINEEMGNVILNRDLLVEAKQFLLKKNILIENVNIEISKIKSNEKMYSHIPSISPVKGYIGSGYGYRTDPIDGKRRMHSGLDFAVNLNTDVLATGDGVVTKAQYDSGWGRYVKIDHGYGYETVYAHLYKIKVKKGQKVKRGDIVGKSGNSGRAAGFHLHYEVHKNNKTIDPKKYFFTGYIK